jgi:hypothetical protein
MLIAANWDLSGAGRVFSRDNATGAWTAATLAQDRRTPGFLPQVRSLGRHRDRVTGIDRVFAGHDPRGVFSGTCYPTVSSPHPPKQCGRHREPQPGDQVGRQHLLLSWVIRKATLFGLPECPRTGRRNGTCPPEMRRDVEAAWLCRLYLDEPDYRSSASRPVDAFTVGLTGT